MFLKRRNIFISKLLLFVFMLSLVYTPVAQAVELSISENGAESDNTVSLEVVNITSIEQTNNSNIVNEADIDSNTGENKVLNNSGNVVLETGSIQENIEIDNSVNYSQVDLECCPDNLTASVDDNGSGSENTIVYENNSSFTNSINQTTSINNVINGSSNSGENLVNGNAGNVEVATGNINVSGQVVNGPVNVSIISQGFGGHGVFASIFGNGSDSKNKIILTNNESSNVDLNSNANIFNLISWDLNTGRNNINENSGNVSLTTGDIFFDFIIKSVANIGGVDLNCCAIDEIFDPDDPSDERGPEEDSEDSDDESDGGNVEDKEADSSSGTLLSEAASTQIADIIGLSDTSSEEAKSLFFWAGIFMITYGLKVVGESLTSKKLVKGKLYN